MDEVHAAEAAQAQVAELQQKLDQLRASHTRLRNQVKQLQRQQYARRAVRAAVRRLR